MQIISRRSGLFLGCIMGRCIMLLIAPLSSHGQFVYDPATNTYQFLAEPFGENTNVTTESDDLVSIDPVTIDSSKFAASIEDALANIRLTHVPNLLDQLRTITQQ